MTDATALARAHTTEAIGAIVDVMRDEFAKPGEVLAAAQAILDRGHGKPTQAIIAVPSKEGAVAALASMSDADLLVTLTEARARRGAQLPAPIVTAAPAVAAPLIGEVVTPRRDAERRHQRIEERNGWVREARASIAPIADCAAMEPASADEFDDPLAL